jgi:hypothetical protein
LARGDGSFRGFTRRRPCHGQCQAEYLKKVRLSAARLVGLRVCEVVELASYNHASRDAVKRWITAFKNFHRCDLQAVFTQCGLNDARRHRAILNRDQIPSARKKAIYERKRDVVWMA